MFLFAFGTQLSKPCNFSHGSADWSCIIFYVLVKSLKGDCCVFADVVNLSDRKASKPVLVLTLTTPSNHE